MPVKNCTKCGESTRVSPKYKGQYATCSGCRGGQGSELPQTSEGVKSFFCYMCGKMHPEGSCRRVKMHPEGDWSRLEKE